MGAFDLAEDHVLSPEVLYHGMETSQVRFERCIGDHRINFEIDLDKPEVWQWRHYYDDSELNELSRLFKFSFTFVTNQERAFNAGVRLPVRVQPFLYGGTEYSVCFAYDELSPGQFKFWLIGIARRIATQDEFDTRIKQIVKYWTK